MAVAMPDTVFMDTEPAGKHGVFAQETPIAAAAVQTTTQLVSIPQVKEALGLLEEAIKESTTVVVDDVHALVVEANTTTTVDQTIIKTEGLQVLPAEDMQGEMTLNATVAISQTSSDVGDGNENEEDIEALLVLAGLQPRGKRMKVSEVAKKRAHTDASRTTSTSTQSSNGTARAASAPPTSTRVTAPPQQGKPQGSQQGTTKSASSSEQKNPRK